MRWHYWFFQINFVFVSLAFLLLSCSSKIKSTAKISNNTGSGGAATESIDSSAVCAGTTVGDVKGSAICQSGTPLGADAAPEDILSGKSAWTSEGKVVEGTLTDKGEWNISTSFPGEGYYSGYSNLPTASKFCKGSKIFAVEGTATCQLISGGSNASAEDVLSGTYFWNSSGASIGGTLPNRGVVDLRLEFPGAGYISATSHALSASDICSGTTINNVAGTAVCSGMGPQIPSGLHRSKGGTPAQLSSAAEISATDTLTSGYREIVAVSSDDDGVSSTTNVNKVTRGTNVWNGAVSRKVCGMGLATADSRIADCDSRHTTKPDWDESPTDGKLSWNGAVNGNASESSWTLVTVYDSSKNNGDTCSSNCREVWRDDVTGLLWSDQIGDLSTNANQGVFNWCLASGNLQNAGSLDCTAGTTNSYNKAAISLCAEASGVSTPAGIHDATAANDLASWANSGTSVRDAKGGMLRALNSDPVGAAQSPSIRWRLPTKYDWEQADLDGIARVVPNPSGNFWASTIYSAVRSNAWYYSLASGMVFSAGRSGTAYVRCVGR